MDDNSMAMRIFVTGGSGFVGSHLVERLRFLGHEVMAPSHENFDLMTLTYGTNWESMDAVIHLAATVGGIGFNQANPVRCLNENLLMATNLFRSMERDPPKKFIALGSVCAYPKYTPTPFVEDDLWNGYPEETNAPYGLAKRVLLAQCQAYRQKGLNAIYLLPANMYGHGDHFDLENSHVIPALIRKCVEAKETGSAVTIWGSGEATRDFLYVDDCVDAIIKAMLLYDSSEPVNVGTGREVSIGEVAGMIAEVVGISPERFVFNPGRPDGQPRRVLDVSRARGFGFTAKTSLEDGLRETIEWYAASVGKN
jgi:GDP-L-fucose synthase